MITFFLRDAPPTSCFHFHWNKKINNIWITKQQIKLEIEQEEAMCYKYELEFLNKIPNCSWELKKHAINFIIEFGSLK